MREIEPLRDEHGNRIAWLSESQTGLVYIEGGLRHKHDCRALHAWLTSVLYGDAVVVPRGPTEDMLWAGSTAIADDLRTDLVWGAMIAAAKETASE